MVTRIFALAFALLPAGPALALSCLAPDPVRFYNDAREAQGTYMVVLGTFTPEAADPVASVENASRVSTWKGRLVGQSLDVEGFNLPFDAPISYRYVCLDDISCPGSAPAFPMIAFLLVTEAGAVLTSDSCNGWIIANPTEDDVAALEDCHTGGSCEELD
jgi:hypothetical protein